jgi:hypothetical protein
LAFMNDEGGRKEGKKEGRKMEGGNGQIIK